MKFMVFHLGNSSKSNKSEKLDNKQVWTAKRLPETATKSLQL